MDISKFVILLFCRTYDAEKQLKIMNEAGLMQSYIPQKK